MLEQILERLPGRGGGGQGPAAAGGPSVAEQVRAGIEQLEREKSAAADADASRTAREDHAARIKALEERTPAEDAGTPVGRFRAGVQRVFYGLDDPRR
jgi:hypothetical protein